MLETQGDDATIHLIDIKFKAIRDKQRIAINRNSNSIIANGLSKEASAATYKDIKLTFEQSHDQDENLNIMAFIYQEYNNVDNNRMLIYDIPRKKLTRDIKINPIYTAPMFTNKYGLNVF